MDDSDFEINANAIAGVALSTAASHTGTFQATIQASIFNCANAFGFGSFQVLGGGTGTSHYKFDNNQINNTKFNGITLNSDHLQTTHAIITNNIIDGNGATNNGNGIFMRQDENSTMNALISGNTIGGFNADHIALFSQDATVNDAGIEFSATVVSNGSVEAPLDGFGAGLYVDVLDNSPDTFNDTCLDIRTNTLKGTDTAEFFDWDISIQLVEERRGSHHQMVQSTNPALVAANPGVNRASFFTTVAGSSGGKLYTANEPNWRCRQTKSYPRTNQPETNPMVRCASSQHKLESRQRFHHRAQYREPVQAHRLGHAAGRHSQRLNRAARRQPGWQRRALFAPPAAPALIPLQSGETVTVPAFTLPAGKSVTVVFQVTVNGPQLPLGTTKIVNQGTVLGQQL